MKDIEGKVPDRDAIMKDIHERFKDDLEMFDTLQVTLIKDGKGVGQASMKNEDLLFMKEVFQQDMADVLANLAMAIKEQIKNK